MAKFTISQWSGIILIILALLMLTPLSFSGKTNLTIILMIVIGIYHLIVR